jgi:hypothetical protein
VTATALVAAVGDRSSFKNGRQFAAWLGLVPKQRSSGGRARLFGISKRGDRYLRTLLIHGARSALGRVPPAAQCRRSRRMVVRSVGSNKSFVSSFPFFPVDLPVGKVERGSVEWSRATSRPRLVERFAVRWCTRPSEARPGKIPRELRSSSAQTQFRKRAIASSCAYFETRSLPLRFLAMNAIRMRWEMLRACIF